MTVRLSAIVTSEVLCPIVIGTPEVAVPICIPFDVSVVSIERVDPALTSTAPADVKSISPLVAVVSETFPAVAVIVAEAVTANVPVA